MLLYCHEVFTDHLIHNAYDVDQEMRERQHQELQQYGFNRGELHINLDVHLMMFVKVFSNILPILTSFVSGSLAGRWGNIQSLMTETLQDMRENICFSTLIKRRRTARDGLLTVEKIDNL